MSHSPENLLDRSLLRQLAGDQAFVRGEESFAQGQVRHLHFGVDRVTARVSGARTYQVKLWKGRGELQHSCSCPAGSEAAFCKHCVAVGLAWLAGAEGTGGADAGLKEPAAGGNASPEAAQARARLHAHLRTLDPERLIGLVLEASDYDDILRRRLLLEAAGVVRLDGGGRKSPARPLRPDLEAYRRLLREAIETPDYVDYDAMPDYAQGVQDAIHPLGHLLREGAAAAVVELAEFALVELDKVSDLLDGSDGSLNAVYDDLQRYHLEACRLARPDPEALAERLLGYEIEGGLGVFNNALKAYADVLGPVGAAAWRRLLLQEWSSLPVLKGPPAAKGRVSRRESIDYRRFQLQALMERLADSEGDTQTLIAVKSADLSSAHDYLALAELHDSAGEPARALARAEEGLRVFAGTDDAAGLRDFLIGAYERAGRAQDAQRLLWEEFAHSPDAEHYRRLRAHFNHAGLAAEWRGWRERALTFLRERSSHRSDGSTLVEILLEERRYEDAWQEAVRGGCRVDLWLQLAARREKRHPADALRVYQSRLEPTIALGGQNAYREAIELLDKIRALLDRLGRGDDFASYRAEVRAAHRQKRNFLKLLDASGS